MGTKKIKNNKNYNLPIQIENGIYLFIIFVLFPLFFYDRYWNMAFFKWIFYLFSTLFFLCIWIVSVPVVEILKKKNHQVRSTKRKSNPFLCTKNYVLCYGAVCILGFMCCESKQAAWMGTDGWYMGLLAQLLFVLTFLIMYMYGVSEKLFLGFFMGGSAIVYIIAILQRYGVNVFYLYWEMPEEVKRDYLSTIGSRGWFAGFAAGVFPLAFYVYYVSKNRIGRIIGGVNLFITSACLLIMNTDSVYPAVSAVLLVLLIFAIGNRERVRRFIEIMIIFWGAGLIMALWRLMGPVEMRDLRGLSVYTQNVPLCIVFLLTSVCVFMCYTGYCKKKESIKYDKKTINLVRLILALCPAAAIIIYLFVAGLNTAGVFHIKNGLFLFDEFWGDGRGFIWSFSLKMFWEADFKSKLLGVGHDCFAYHAYSNPEYAQMLKNVFADDTLANAHNEWINSLICQGLLGFICYIGIFVTTFIKGLLCMEKESGSILVPGIGLCALGYMVNNFFGYQQASGAAVIFVAMGVAAFYQKKN